MRKRGFFILIAIAIFILGAVLIFAGYAWFLNKQERVLAGTAKPVFPYPDYTQEELNKLYPQYIENTAPTVQSPEETHRKFVEALKKQDFDQAVKCCFREGDWERMKEGLQKTKEKGELPLMIKDIDQEINKESMDSWKATYSYSVWENGKKYGQIMSFLKSSNGVWLIESL